MTHSPSRLKLAIFWCGLCALAGLLLLGTMELLLRLALSRQFTAESSFPLVPSLTPGLGYQLAPNHSEAGIQTDANGFRIRVAGEKSPRHNILIVGDSISFGSGVVYAKSYVPALEDRLNRELNESTAVWNAGVPGYNTSQEAAMLEKAAPLVHPELVVVEYCMNDYLDAPVLTANGTLDQTAISDGSRFSPVAILYNLRTLVFLKEKLKDVQRARPEWFPVWAHYIHHIQAKPGWAKSEQALRAMRTDTRQMGARLLVVIFPVEQQLRIGDRAPQDAMLQFTRANGIQTLDLYDSFRAHWREGLYINFWKQAGQFDKLHPNDRGHALAAEQISAEIVRHRDWLLPRSITVAADRKQEELAALR